MLALAERGYIIFFSLAPLQGPITLPPEVLKLRDRAWVIASGEQGPARILPRCGLGVV